MSDPARDGYQCHGAMTPIQSRSKGVIGYICESCGITRNGLRTADPDRPRADRVLYRLALCARDDRRMTDVWVSW